MENKIDTSPPSPLALQTATHSVFPLQKKDGTAPFGGGRGARTLVEGCLSSPAFSPEAPGATPCLIADLRVIPPPLVAQTSLKQVDVPGMP